MLDIRPHFDSNYCRQVARLMMRLIGGFVRGGVPVVEGAGGRVCWDTLQEHNKYLHVVRTI